MIGRSLRVRSIPVAWTGVRSSPARSSPHRPSPGRPEQTSQNQERTGRAAGAAGHAGPASRIRLDRAARCVQLAAAWSWRVIAIAAMIYGIGWIARYLSEVLVPIAVAILITALVQPVTNRRLRSLSGGFRADRRLR